MKKQFRALSLCLTLALCVFGSTAALAEAPAATPAPQDPTSHHRCKPP